MNTFKCALDILDALDDMAGDGALVDQVIARMDDVRSLAPLIPQVERTIAQLAAASQ